MRLRSYDWRVFILTPGGKNFGVFNCRAMTETSAVKKAKQFIYHQGRLAHFYHYNAIRKDHE